LIRNKTNGGLHTKQESQYKFFNLSEFCHSESGTLSTAIYTPVNVAITVGLNRMTRNYHEMFSDFFNLNSKHHIKLFIHFFILTILSNSFHHIN